MAVDGYKDMLVNSELDDVLLSRAFTGLETNSLRPSIVASGLDPTNLPTNMTRERADALYGSQGSAGIKRWRDIWSAGHSVSGVRRVESVRELVARTQQNSSRRARLHTGRWRQRLAADGIPPLVKFCRHFERRAGTTKIGWPHLTRRTPASSSSQTH